MKRNLIWGSILLGAFVCWTAAVCMVDVQPAGPCGSSVGFATINTYFHDLIGVHLWLYDLTDRLSLIPIVLVVGFGFLGLGQWIGRRSLWRVDREIHALGAFYLAVGAIFVFFEVVAINFRPVLIDGALEASYPSSTIMLVLCVMGSSMPQVCQRIGHPVVRRVIFVVGSLFAVLMVMGRLISGVHWVTDIIGGGLLSGGLTSLYAGFCAKISI